MGCVAVEIGKAGKGLHEEILPGLGAPWADVAVAGDFAVDEARVERADLFVAEADFFDDAGAEVLDHDVVERRGLLLKVTRLVVWRVLAAQPGRE